MQPPVPAEPGAPATDPVADPALQAIGAGAVPVDAATALGPIRGLDTQDSRVVIADGTRVWWGISGGIFALTERSTVDYIWLDAGDRYVTVEEGTLMSCWRDICSAFPDSSGAPSGVQSVTRQADGMHILASDGSVSRFVPASVDSDVPLDAESTPQGSFEAGMAAMPLPANTAMRASVNETDFALSTTGDVFEHRGGQWVQQGAAPTAMSLAAFDEQWAVLSARGWLTLGTVPTLQIEQSE